MKSQFVYVVANVNEFNHNYEIRSCSYEKVAIKRFIDTIMRSNNCKNITIVIKGLQL